MALNSQTSRLKSIKKTIKTLNGLSLTGPLWISKLLGWGMGVTSHAVRIAGAKVANNVIRKRKCTKEETDSREQGVDIINYLSKIYAKHDTSRTKVILRKASLCSLFMPIYDKIEQKFRENVISPYVN